MSGYETVVQLLLEEGYVNPNCKDKRGRTPLSLAAKDGRRAVVQLLAKEGVRPKLTG